MSITKVHMMCTLRHACNEVGWVSAFRRMLQSHSLAKCDAGVNGMGAGGARGAALARSWVLTPSTNGGTAAERGFQQSGLCKHAVFVEVITCHMSLSRRRSGVSDVDAKGQP